MRGLVWCSSCGTAYTGDPSRSSTGYHYHYYGCRKKRTKTYDKRAADLSCPRVKAEWLEELVWADVRCFLENPGALIKRVREQLAEYQEGGDLEERHASLTRRLAAKQAEKSRYVKLYGQGHIDDEELEVHVSDLRNRVENLKLLIASVESDLATKEENTMVAASTEAWLRTLKKNLADVEQDTEEAWASRRELAKLLVEKIAISRTDEGRTKVDITYRFGPPDVKQGAESADGVQNSEEFARAHARGGTQGLLRGHPKMSSYEVAVQRVGSGGD